MDRLRAGVHSGGDVLAVQPTAGNSAVAYLMVQRFDAKTLPAETWQKVKDAIDVYAYADPQMVGKIADGWYAKKAGDVNTKHELLTGKYGKVEAAGEAGAGGGMGAYGGARKDVVDLGKLGKAYEVLAEAGLVAGAELNLGGELVAQLGPVAAKAKAAFSAFAGVYVKAEAQGFVRKGEQWWDIGLGASGKASAMAGAKAKGAASVSFSVDELSGAGLELGAEGEVFAGAAVEAEGEAILDIRNKEIALGGKVAAFAGAKATGTIKGSGLLYGRQAFTYSVTGTAQAGAGGSAAAKFKLTRGKLTINLGADAALGIGGGAEGATDVDFKPIGVFIMRRVAQGTWALQSSKTPAAVNSILNNPAAVEAKLRKSLAKYRDFKTRQLRNRRADNYTKIEKVQAYIDWEIPRHKVKGHSGAAAIDAFVKKVVEEELSIPPDIVVTATVTDGKLTQLTDDGAVAKLKGPASKRTGKNLASVGA